MSSRLNFRWQEKPSAALFLNLQKMDQSFFDGPIAGLASYYSAMAEGYAKDNRPWKDRSTDARNALYGMSEGTTIYIGTTNLEYGLYLELGTRNMKPYPIIEPTMVHIAPLYFGAVQDTIRRKLSSG